MTKDEKHIIHLLDELAEHERSSVLGHRGDAAAADLLGLIDFDCADPQHIQ